MKDYQRLTVAAIADAVNFALQNKEIRALYEKSQIGPVDALALQIERGIHAFTVCELHTHDLGSHDSAKLHLTMQYSAITFLICDLLRDDKFELMRAICEHKVAPRDVAKLRETVCPSILGPEREEFNRRKGQKIEQKVSHAFVCKKCGCRDSLMQEAQARSSDEAPTLILQCVGCGYRWIQSK